MIFTLDGSGRFTYINLRVKRPARLRPQRAGQAPFTTLVMPEDLDCIDTLLSQPSSLPGESFHVELRQRRGATAATRAAASLFH